MTLARMSIQTSFILIICVLPMVVAIAGPENLNQGEKTLFGFQTSAELNHWRIINDGVMGGLSKGEIVFNNRNAAVFQGNVSLENSGGFSLVRTKPKPYRLGDFTGIVLRVKGDGKKYQFRLRMNDRFDGVSYRYHFETESKKWITIKVPFNESVPVFRGRVLDNVQPINPSKIEQIGFLISDKQAGPFRLEIDWIKAYRD